MEKTKEEPTDCWCAIHGSTLAAKRNCLDWNHDQDKCNRILPAPSVKASEAINFYEIETDLREYFTKNRDDKGSGYAIRLLKALAGTQWKEGQRADLIETAFKEGYARRNSQHYSRDWAEFKEKYLTGKEADQVNPDFTLWVVVNKWKYDEGAHKWFNDYISELKNKWLTHSELYSLFQNK